MAVHPSKAELERVWESGPIDWLKDYSKKSRKGMPRIVKIRFYNKQYVHEIEQLVWAKKSDTPHNFSYAILAQHFPGNKDWPTSNYEITWRAPE